MADYIDRNILSQAYIHVEPGTELPSAEFSAITQQLTEFARARAGFFLYPDVSVEIELEGGSLKARVTIMGTVFLLMQGVANYPNFREGISLIHQDAKKLASHIVTEAQFLFEAKHEDVIRTEARTGILTSIHKVMSQLDHVAGGAAAGRPASTLAVELDEVRREIDKLLNNLATDDDRNAIRTGLSTSVAALPTMPRQPKRGRNTPDTLALYSERRRELLGRLKP